MSATTLQSTPAKRVILGVSGSIAAYKAAEIVGMLRQEGLEVFVIMTRSAAEFITPLTLATLSRNPVLGDLAEEKEGGWRPGLACGLADDSIGAVALATRAPVLVAPAMNGKMWEHPATRENTERLRARGVEFVGPVEGMLACGYEGTGRLAEPADIVLRAVRMIFGA